MDEHRKAIAEFALKMYTGEPCRICGIKIIEADLPELVFAGYSTDDQARAAHGLCWSLEKDHPENWKYP